MAELLMRMFSKITLVLTLLLFVGVTVAPAQPLRQGGGAGLLRLAERGDARAQTRLGFMLANGRGAPQNYAEAAYWYRRAAEQGEPDAQYLLGICFDLAQGVPRDWVEAHKWFNLSASRTAKSDEREHRARMRDAIESKLTNQQLKVAQSLALAWRPKRER
jgi:TPR repeat protein